MLWSAMTDFALLLVFPALMILAAVSDLFTMTIPNRIAIGLAGGFFVFALLFHMPPAEIGMHVLAGFAVLVVTFGLFACGWFGGGDAKLAAATALWMGFDNLAPYLLLSTIAGGMLTLAILWLRKWPLPAMLMRQPWIARLHDKGAGVPYGIALAAAGLFLFPDTGIFTAATIV